MIIWLLDIAIK